MGFLTNVVAGLLGKGHTAAAAPAVDLDDWNRIGRARAQRACSDLEAVIDRGEDVEDMDLAGDERPEALADAVLDQVVALNAAGQWRQARARFDPAHTPFVSHMGDRGLHAVLVLGPEHFLVRLGDQVLQLDGDQVTPVEGACLFAISRNRRWLVLATDQGLVVSAGLGAAAQHTLPWPKDIDVQPHTVRCLDIADNGTTLALAGDQFGIWLVQQGAWTALAPRPGVADDAQDADQDDGEGEGEESATSGEAVRKLGTAACPVYLGTYAELKARFGGPLGLDAAHVAVSPDGRWVAYGWQDSPGHYLDRVTDTAVEPQTQIAARSDYPYQLRFTDDSRRLLSNSRYGSGGITVCQDLGDLDDLGNLGDAATEPPQTDEYLRAWALTELPGARFGLDQPVAWIGGAGWSHGAALDGGKPVFTHFFGSALRGLDVDPASGRAAVASASGVLHVLDPFAEAEPGRERGYHPRRELFRWIFWDTLSAPIRW